METRTNTGTHFVLTHPSKRGNNYKFGIKNTQIGGLHTHSVTHLFMLFITTQLSSVFFPCACVPGCSQVYFSHLMFSSVLAH